MYKNLRGSEVPPVWILQGPFLMQFQLFRWKSTAWNHPQSNICDVDRFFFEFRVNLLLQAAIEKNGKRTIPSDQGAERACRADH